MSATNARELRYFNRLITRLYREIFVNRSRDISVRRGTNRFSRIMVVKWLFFFFGFFIPIVFGMGTAFFHSVWMPYASNDWLYRPSIGRAHDNSRPTLTEKPNHHRFGGLVTGRRSTARRTALTVQCVHRVRRDHTPFIVRPSLSESRRNGRKKGNLFTYVPLNHYSKSRQGALNEIRVLQTGAPACHRLRLPEIARKTRVPRSRRKRQCRNATIEEGLRREKITQNQRDGSRDARLLFFFVVVVDDRIFFFFFYVADDFPIKVVAVEILIPRSLLPPTRHNLTNFYCACVAVNIRRRTRVTRRNRARNSTPTQWCQPEFKSWEYYQLQYGLHRHSHTPPP